LFSPSLLVNVTTSGSFFPISRFPPAPLDIGDAGIFNPDRLEIAGIRTAGF
jgi:hypothetical protein